MARALHPELGTDRSILNQCYLTEAFSALRNDDGQLHEEFAWIATMERMRRVILYALGAQHWDADLIRDVARSICLERMRTKEAVDFIRLVEAARLSHQRGELEEFEP